MDPATRETPRNPRGGLVTIADFDLTVSTPDRTSMTGQYTDASHWAVCACQGATLKAVGTIRASYPAKLLANQTRVPGVALDTTVTVGIAAGKTAWNPPSCAAPAPAPVAAAPAPPAAVAPSAPAPLTVAPQTGTKTPAAVTPPAPAPAPQNIVVTGNPAEAFVTWTTPNASPGPVSHLVERWKTSDPACCRATSPTLSAVGWSGWIDPLMWSGDWTYQVTAIYTDGRRGSASSSYTYPEPQAPQGFKAVQVGKDTVLLRWQPVRGASYYVVGGPPSNVAIRVDTTVTTLTLGAVPLGKATWQVAAMYQGRAAGSPQAGSPFATTSLDVVNPRYRLVAEAIRVTTETADMPLSEDGMYDEVFVASFAEVMLRGSGGSGSTLLSRLPVTLSAVHGDISNWLPLERSQAGTASANGGIRAGDVIPVLAQPTMASLAKVPLVLWAGQLLPGQHDLVLHPTIWEVDQPESAMARDLTQVCINLLCGWRNFMAGNGGTSAFRPGPQAAIAGTQIAVVDGDLVWMNSHGGPIHLERHDTDRPIGLVRTSTVDDGTGLSGRWFDKMVILSSEKIEAALASGQATIQVRFWDHWTLPNTPPSTISFLNGDYTLVIRIERMP
jgi:hypothetical protein